MAENSILQTNSSGGRDVVTTFIRVLNSRSSYMASQLFSEDIIMEWFGRTIIGRNNVLNFLYDEAMVSNHDLIEVKKSKQANPPPRALKRFRQPLTPEKDEDMHNDSGFGSGIYESCDSSFSSSGSLTPSQNVAMDLSRLHVTKLKDDGLALAPLCRNFKTPSNTRLPAIKHPLLKKQPMLLKRLKEVDLPTNLEFVDAAGILYFRVDGDFYNAGTSWSKPCHLQIGYQRRDSPEDLLICFLLYNSDMPCRRNLSQVFDQCE
ncbi:uncharacterized protein LOC117651000 [Thrips palmi]|uniref:Uncharacterized protein LOC117651000 n=1 Tax=Thrips palmi TaxID=161013 RepID=A0A6P8ZZH5_THRPL|nr:uncharacterized protein LOC117651000 [Thrips palmi]XP_034250581.1 uncharacterized protein LOC117651000 [Thrips palmi]XP_034250582.1 uncharacterized protein LOC117651000 [Thrips palmi]